MERRGDGFIVSEKLFFFVKVSALLKSKILFDSVKKV
jgi:hypothetical protein